MIARAAALLFLLVAAMGQRSAPVPRVADDYSRRRLILAIEDGRSPTPADLNLLISIARDNDGDNRITGDTRAQAIRALGRLERRDLVPVLTARLEDKNTRGPASLALLLTLRAHAALSGDKEIEVATETALRLTDSAIVLRHLPYTNPAQVQLAETKLMAMVNTSPPPYGLVAASLEVLARKHRRLHQLDEDTIRFLERGVHRILPSMEFKDDYTPRVALAALMAAGKAGEDVIRTGLRDRADQVRRTGMAVLSSAGATIDASVRTELTREALGDPSAFVRYEALRGWVRRETPAHGCGPITDALADDSMHVVLAALDALGNSCPDDDTITDRLVSEARTPPTIGEWQREAHAFVALARRSPERAATAMPAFISHQVWQVRMYAARGAAAMKDITSLERLAYDAHDNVREATLAPLRTLKQSNSDGVFLAALGRSDYQLLRTAAMALKDAPSDKHLLMALVGAFERVTADKKDTSRDTRLALLERIRAMGSRDQLQFYGRLLKDFDPRIAAAAAEACTALSVQPCVANPQLQPRPPVPSPSELTERVRGVVELDNGRKFEITFNRELAPLAYTRFVRLARARYYDGLTFHRVEPNFVIQGGSPGANEYVGDGPFMRDELGGSHRRGTVGISTRGRDTGDAQIFINLVDNPRLDLEYTVFGSVPEAQMTVVDAVQEGTRIVRVSLLPY